MFLGSALTHLLRTGFRHTMRLERTTDLELPIPRERNRHLLYVHVPFCESLCPFCSFHKVVLKPDQATAYFRALRSEIVRHHESGYDFSAVYVGGGTPTVLPEALAGTLNLIRELFKVKQISVETNPNHLRENVLSILQDVGINRLSVGVQSFDDSLLRSMDRYHKYGSGFEIADRLQRTQGLFETLNADMIFNLPRQTLASLQRDISILTDSVKVDQVSYYPLMTASSTLKAMSKTMGNVTFDKERLFYETVLEAMQRDYVPSTVWNFNRRNSMIDEYIVDHQEYVGVGSGSFSYLNGVFYANTFSIREYIYRINHTESAATAFRRLNTSQQKQYDLLMNLFGLVLNREWLEAKYGGRFDRDLWAELKFLKLLGIVEEIGSTYSLTRKGMYHWLVMMREFFIGVNNLRDQMRAYAASWPGEELTEQKIR